MKSTTIHNVSLGFGLTIFAYSLWLAIVINSTHFYTFFALGSWLILDWVDYKKNGNSILGYFYNHHHRDAFFIFFIAATIFAITIDYFYGVRISQMWTWTGYAAPEYLRMYTIMNGAYILSMYELFRVIRSYLKSYLPDKNTVHTRIKAPLKKLVLTALFISGLVFVVAPTYVLLFKTSIYIEYVMVLPFLGMLFICDAITESLHGESILFKILRFNLLHIFSILLTIAIGSIVTELLNLFAGEWAYLRMPFDYIHILGIPVSVFFGWIPLVLGVIAMINMIKHFDYMRDTNQIKL